MHCEVSGCGDLLVEDDKAAIEAAKAYLSYFGQSFKQEPPRVEGVRPAYRGSLAEIVPNDESQAFDMYAFVAGIIDESSFSRSNPTGPKS
jgi:acetyl-CoA carboxylase carboxyltransferase component